ncbi:MAG TPA: efflux RND transporter periplasmic adaptor subunit [Pirellulales bacterium]|jgi:multidrug efflux system membrane fusion protein|nr:efflux RND transporter periplasmic adaptor subunit [Pirellulales bacterium]
MSGTIGNYPFAPPLRAAVAVFLYSALACFALLVSGCEEEHTAASTAEKPALVRVQQPVTKSVTDYEYFTGRSQAPYSLDVRCKVNGYLVRWNYDAKSDQLPLKDFNFVVGQEVKRDQVLFKIDPRPYQATYDQAVAQVNLAKAQLQLAQADYSRALVVSKTPGAISAQDVDKYLAAQSKAEAEVAAQQASAESALLNLQFTDVKTDIEGIVSRNLLSVGNLVEANTLLTTVVSQDPMYAYFDVDEITRERIATLMREGKLESAREGNKYAKYPVDLGLTGGETYPYTAYIDFVNNQIDPTTGTLQVRGMIDNPKPPVGPRVFVPGMFLRVRLPIGDAHPALLVPQAAVGTDQSQKYVFVANQENIVEYRPIKVGEVQADNLQIALPEQIMREANGIRIAKPDEKGAEPSLTSSDRVIVGGLQRIRPGMKVEIQPPEAK